MIYILHIRQHIYDYIDDVQKLWKLTDSQLQKVLGSETLMWGEMVDAANIEQKLWPRSAALAEALWGAATVESAEKAHDKRFRNGDGWYAADPRMQQWRKTLMARGVQAEALQPQWCEQRGAYACTINQGRGQ